MTFPSPLRRLVRADRFRVNRVRVDWALMSRIVAAVIGGYALTSLLTIVATLALPFLGVARAQAMHATSMASFFLYAAIVMAVFHASSVKRAWIWLLAVGIPAGLCLWAFRTGSAL